MPKLGLGLDVTAGTGTLANPDFVSTWTVSGDETARTVTLPLTNVSGITTINFTIDWGDGSSLSTVTAHGDADRIHIYAENGTYTVTMATTNFVQWRSLARVWRKKSAVWRVSGDKGQKWSIIVSLLRALWLPDDQQTHSV